MCFAYQRGTVPSLLMKPGGNAWSVRRQGHSVREYSVGADILACNHGGACGHADRVLIVRSPEIDSTRGQLIDYRRAGDPSAVASERIETLLVGGDEENIAAHRERLEGKSVISPRILLHC